MKISDHQCHIANLLNKTASVSINAILNVENMLNVKTMAAKDAEKCFRLPWNVLTIGIALAYAG